MEKQDNLKQGSILLGKETIDRDYSGQMQSVYRIKINDGNQEMRQEKEKLDKLEVELDIETDDQVADREKIIEKHEENNDEMVQNKEHDQESDTETHFDESEKVNMRKLIRRLALYPIGIERPICEAEISGERKKFQVISKRGNRLRIFYKRRYEWVEIDDIKNFTVIS